MRAAGLVAAALLAGAPAAPPAWALVAAERMLEDRLRGAGAEPLEPLPGPPPAVRGELSGSGPLRLVLFAGCGPGAEASRAAALAAAADLARTPRRHAVELVLCAAGGGGADAARRAAAAWLARHPEAASRRALLAVLHLEIGERPGARPSAPLLSAERAGGRGLPPAWLAHAALRGAAASGGSLAIGGPRAALLGQLVGRHARPRAASGSQPFLAAAVPALTLTDGDASRWPPLLTGVVRRLDGLAGRPRGDDVYLAAAGRIWSRRDLYWVGLAVWVALIAGGRPGSWRGAGSGARRRRGRRYLPGFALRMLFLGTLLLAPVTTLVLLAPAALLTLAPMRRPAVALAGRLLGALPTLLLAAAWTAALAGGRVTAWPAQPLRLALVLAGVGLALWLVGRPPARGAAASGQARASSASISTARSHSRSLL